MISENPSASKHCPGRTGGYLQMKPVESENKPPVEVGDFGRITHHFRGIYGRIYLQQMKAKPEDVN